MLKSLRTTATFVMFCLLALLLLNAPPARGQGPSPEAETRVIRAAQPIVMTALPWDDPAIRVPPPRQFRMAPESAHSTFTINYIAAGGTDAWGEPCLEWDPDAKTAFSYAASIWASLIPSKVPIRINACWAYLSSTTTLGYSGSSAVRDFTGAPVSGTYYNFALADALAGTDLYPANPDSNITYNSRFAWYYGTDGNPGPGNFDLVSVALHEMGHSLNFSGRMRYGASSCTSASYGCWATANYPGIYDRFVENGSGQSILDTGLFPNLSAALGSQLTGGNLYFDGTNANAANGGSPVKIYAPGTWSSGSSYSHLDYSTYVGTANRLMVYSISSNSSIHDPGAITLGMFKDMGWNKYSQSITVNTQAPASKTLDGTFTVNASASSGLGITYSASGGCTNSGADFTMTSSIVNCVVSYTQAGDTDYNAATTVTETVSAVCNNAQTVTTNGDSGAGSLRQALREACSSGAITFDSSLSGGTITHSSAVTIDRNVTLNGALLSSPVGLVFTDLTINSGTTLDTGTNELTVSGTLTNNGVLKHTTPSQNVTTGGGTVAFEDARGIVTTQIQSTGTNNLGSTNIVVQANNAPASCGVNRFTSNMVLRQFNLTPTNTSSIAATVRLYFAPGELNSLDAGSLKMYHCNGTAWEKLDGTYTYGTDGASGYAYVELPGVTSFSPFALGPNDAPTGAQLVAFRARYVNTKNRVAVKWQTGSELNLVGFNVWHRVNGGAWKMVNAAPIAAKQLGNIRGANYRLYDKNLKSGKTYQYKLELLTTHGSTWSNVVKLKIP